MTDCRFILDAMALDRRVGTNRSTVRIVLTLPLAFVIGCSSGPLNGPSSVEAARPLPTVTRVIDGDTIVAKASAR